VAVHLVSPWNTEASQPQLPRFGPDGQPPESSQLGIKVFADAAFYAIKPDAKNPSVVPFLLKKDAEAFAAKNGGKLATYTEALGAINVGQ